MEILRLMSRGCGMVPKVMCKARGGNTDATKATRGSTKPICCRCMEEYVGYFGGTRWQDQKRIEIRRLYGGR